MTWQSRLSKISIGDTVKYKASFLRSTGQLTGDIPFAKGKVTDIKPLGDNQIATIDWGDENIPARVLTSNLSKVTQRGVADE